MKTVGKQVAATSYVKEYFLATAHLALGYREDALKCLEKAGAERDPWLVWLGTEAKLDSLRNVAIHLSLLLNE